MARLGTGALKIGPLFVTSVLVAATVASCATTARISDVYTALDGNGDRRRNVFVTDTKEVHCIAEMGIGRPGVTVEAVIREIQSYDFVVDKFFETNRVLANAEQSPHPASGIQKLDVVLTPVGPNGMPIEGAPFPPGRFVCEVRLDGELSGQAIFNIDFAPCPTSAIVPATICFGFYKNAAVCPRYGLTSTDPAQCKCDELKGWQCDP